MHTSAGAACGRDDDDGADAPELCVRASLPTSQIEEIFACVNSGLEATTTSPILLFDSVSTPAPVNMECNKTEGKQAWQRRFIKKSKQGKSSSRRINTTRHDKRQANPTLPTNAR